MSKYEQIQTMIDNQTTAFINALQSGEISDIEACRVVLNKLESIKAKVMEGPAC